MEWNSLTLTEYWAVIIELKQYNLILMVLVLVVVVVNNNTLD